jgi:hypothetical protein
MKHLYLLLLYASLLGACDHRKKVEIWIENVSVPGKAVQFTSFMGDSMIDRRNVARDSVADRVLSYFVYLPAGSSGERRFRFLAEGNKAETGCAVCIDSLKKGAFLHVRYEEQTIPGGMWSDSTETFRTFGCTVDYH